ncbi:hypothetical protein IWW38_004995 [Coemansia aciculifera]|uniref:Uncharacterized protein n=1 Tax=Coemansia aciculifera TaxID=417176 RepID=A0ACC1LXY4_9FUNG|nr:hypothetical protein IWW38_004995 [Coemansia aciculifera]
MLGRFGVLNRDGVAQISKVSLICNGVEDDVFLARNADAPIEQHVHRILELATTLRMPGDTATRRLYNSVVTAPKTAIIKNLVFYKTHLGTGDIISIVSALPSLVSLRCVIDAPEPWIQEIPKDEQPHTLRTKYYPLSHNFRYLGLSYTAGSSAETLAFNAATFSLLCPRFVYVDIPPKLRNSFSREVSWAMVTSFKPYADCLNKLLYK